MILKTLVFTIERALHRFVVVRLDRQRQHSLWELYKQPRIEDHYGAKNLVGV
jgi:hypothetical protein